MRIPHERCCGLDMHKKVIVACLLVSDPNGSVRKDLRTFGTMTQDVLALAD